MAAPLQPEDSQGHKLKRVVIKEELVALLGGYIEALIINQFIYWTERANDYDKFMDEERERNPEFKAEKRHGWIYKSSEELSEELMISASPATMRRHLAKLVKTGYVEERNNPNHKWDRCLQYRVDIRKVQVDLQELGYPLEGYALSEDGTFFKMKNATAKIKNQSLDLKNRTVQNEQAIPETPTEIPSREDTPPAKFQLAPIPAALAELCRIKPELMTNGLAHEVQESTTLLDQAGITPAQIKSFGAWWYAHDWRGKKGEAPKPRQVCECWGQYEENGGGKQRGFTAEQIESIRLREEESRRERR